MLQLNERALNERYSRELAPDFDASRSAYFIKECFANQATYESLTTKLHELALMQFDSKRVWGELAGRLMRVENTLCLEPIPSSIDAAIFATLSNFKACGDSNSAHLLSVWVGHYRAVIGTECATATAQKIDRLQNTLFAIGCGVSEEFAQIDFPFLELVLQSMTSVQLSDLRPKEMGFSGAFHFHPNGMPPNKEDIAQSEIVGVPMLVISAVPDPIAVTGVYLLHWRQSERLL